MSLFTNEYKQYICISHICYFEFLKQGHNCFLLKILKIIAILLDSIFEYKTEKKYKLSSQGNFVNITL